MTETWPHEDIFYVAFVTMSSSTNYFPRMLLVTPKHGRHPWRLWRKCTATQGADIPIQFIPSQSPKIQLQIFLTADVKEMVTLLRYAASRKLPVTHVARKGTSPRLAVQSTEGGRDCWARGD